MDCCCGWRIGVVDGSHLICSVPTCTMTSLISPSIKNFAIFLFTIVGRPVKNAKICTTLKFRAMWYRRSANFVVKNFCGQNFLGLFLNAEIFYTSWHGHFKNGSFVVYLVLSFMLVWVCNALFFNCVFAGTELQSVAMETLFHLALASPPSFSQQLSRRLAWIKVKQALAVGCGSPLLDGPWMFCFVQCAEVQPFHARGNKRFFWEASRLHRWSHLVARLGGSLRGSSPRCHPYSWAMPFLGNLPHIIYAWRFKICHLCVFFCLWVKAHLIFRFHKTTSWLPHLLDQVSLLSSGPYYTINGSCKVERVGDWQVRNCLLAFWLSLRTVWHYR